MKRIAVVAAMMLAGCSSDGEAELTSTVAVTQPPTTSAPAATTEAPTTTTESTASTISDTATVRLTDCLAALDDLFILDFSADPTIRDVLADCRSAADLARTDGATGFASDLRSGLQDLETTANGGDVGFDIDSFIGRTRATLNDLS